MAYSFPLFQVVCFDAELLNSVYRDAKDQYASSITPRLVLELRRATRARFHPAVIDAASSMNVARAIEAMIKNNGACMPLSIPVSLTISIPDDALLGIRLSFDSLLARDYSPANPDTAMTAATTAVRTHLPGFLDFSMERHIVTALYAMGLLMRPELTPSILSSQGRLLATCVASLEACAHDDETALLSTSDRKRLRALFCSVHDKMVKRHNIQDVLVRMAADVQTVMARQKAMLFPLPLVLLAQGLVDGATVGGLEQSVIDDLRTAFGPHWPLG